MTADAAHALPQTCYPTVWLWPGQALYAGPSLNLAPHSGSVWCLAVGIDGPLTVATQDGATRDANSVLIPPRLTHHLTCHGSGLVSCYLEPTSDRAEPAVTNSPHGAATSALATSTKKRLSSADRR